MLLLVFLSALRSGVDRYYLKKAQGIRVAGREVFHYLSPSCFPSSLLFFLNYYIRKLMLILLCFSPSGLVLSYLIYYISNGRASLTVSVIMLAAALVFVINGSIFFFRFTSFLFTARYYFASEKYLSFSQLFSFSYRCMEGKRGLVLKKRLSLAGWLLSCLLVLPTAFVQNYYRETMAALAKDLIGI